MARRITLRESLELTQDLFRADCAMTYDEYWEMRQSIDDAKYELEAENGWLRHAENVGWEEIAYLERVAPWAI